MISINESDINIITILDEKLEDTDVTPMTLLEKRCMDGKKYYLISYSLSELVGKFSRCECCGTIYDSNLDHCPECQKADQRRQVRAQSPYFDRCSKRWSAAFAQ